jgi:hypothetical protein
LEKAFHEGVQPGFNRWMRANRASKKQPIRSKMLRKFPKRVKNIEN